MGEEQNKAKSIFLNAAEIAEASQREKYVARECGEDEALRREVQDLLLHRDGVGAFLEASPADFNLGATLEPPLREAPGTLIGPYKLLEQVGEGGMGVVFLAEQTRPVRRQVALKVIKAGMDTRQVVARFEAERQALALMDHPNIAKVLDAGATDSGRPFFVMELVKGVPITKYCDDRKLTPRDRLALFVQVCQAVQHAHSKGIIHRDLKPSNVMVALYDGKPVPKVIDFGVAKATGGRLTEHTLFTGFGSVVGTPEYMSPEQAELNQLDVDTRSDVYSLGVILYELLTGSTPVERGRFKAAALLEVLRVVREEEPARPSTRLSTTDQLPSIAACRGLEPRKLSGVVRGELDWIVMRCLEKDRARRYDTAVGLARDVERYLTDEAVEACPPSRSYRLRKFARRNKTTFTTASVIAAVLVMATTVSIWQAVRATAEKRRADEQAAIAQAVNDFLNTDLLGQADPDKQVTPQTSPDRDLKVRDALDRASERIAGRFSDQPLVRAAILQTIGEAYNSLGEYQKGERQLEEVLRLRRENLGAESPDTLRTMGLLGTAYMGQLRYDEAERIYKQALTGRRKVLGESDPKTLSTTAMLAGIYYTQGDNAQAELLCLQVLEANRKAHREKDPSSLVAMSVLSNVYRAGGRHTKAEPIMLQLLDIARRLDGPEHPNTLIAEEALFLLYGDLGRSAEAEAHGLRALARLLPFSYRHAARLRWSSRVSRS